MIKERYSPYEELTRAKVSWAAETLTSTGKSDVKQSEYQWGDTQKRARMLYNNLSSILWQSPETMAKLSTYINSAAAQYSDFQTALTSVLEKAWAKPQTITKIVEKLVTPDDTKDTKDTKDNTDYSKFNLWFGNNNNNSNINLWF
jgi:hypothetical protein